MGIAPTDTHATWSGHPIYRLVGGKIVEEWFLEDSLGLMQQLGAVPAPQQAN